MTRMNNARVPLEERTQFAELIKPDIFLSIHANSVVESRDAFETFGVESYYHYGIGKRLSDNLTARVAAATGRVARKSDVAAFRVIRIPFAPAALLELGFMPNMTEYDDMQNSEVIAATARAICNAIVASIGG
jgi:N-acetylmuramoyl-L-alanine amidase